MVQSDVELAEKESVLIEKNLCNQLGNILNLIKLLIVV